MLQRYSLLTVLVALVLVFPNFGFWLDRLRQYTEHNVMPLNAVDGARDLGNGFWGMLIGGGPWGQPCHWTHHLMPGIPWYNQLRLHGFVKNILTDEQKDVFLLKPVTGFPMKLLAVIRTTS
jgi:fatty acid desaturase